MSTAVVSILVVMPSVPEFISACFELSGNNRSPGRPWQSSISPFILNLASWHPFRLYGSGSWCLKWKVICSFIKRNQDGGGILFHPSAVGKGVSDCGGPFIHKDFSLRVWPGKDIRSKMNKHG